MYHKRYFMALKVWRKVIFKILSIIREAEMNLPLEYSAAWLRVHLSLQQNPNQNHFMEMFFWLGVLRLQMQTVFTLNYYKPKRLERHSSTLIFFLLWDALPRAFDAVPFQSKTRHEFNIVAVYLSWGSCRFQMQNFLRPCCLEQFNSSKLF